MPSLRSCPSWILRRCYGPHAPHPSPGFLTAPVITTATSTVEPANLNARDWRLGHTAIPPIKREESEQELRNTYGAGSRNPMVSSTGPSLVALLQTKNFFRRRMMWMLGGKTLHPTALQDHVVFISGPVHLFSSISKVWFLAWLRDHGAQTIPILSERTTHYLRGDHRSFRAEAEAQRLTRNGCAIQMTSVEEYLRLVANIPAPSHEVNNEGSSTRVVQGTGARGTTTPASTANTVAEQTEAGGSDTTSSSKNGQAAVRTALQHATQVGRFSQTLTSQVFEGTDASMSKQAAQIAKIRGIIHTLPDGEAKEELLKEIEKLLENAMAGREALQEGFEKFQKSSGNLIKNYTKAVNASIEDDGLTKEAVASAMEEGVRLRGGFNVDRLNAPAAWFGPVAKAALKSVRSDIAKGLTVQRDYQELPSISTKKSLGSFGLSWMPGKKAKRGSIGTKSEEDEAMGTDNED